MSVSMDDVKKVREITGAGLSSCKEALVKTDGNVDEAVKVLQKEGLAASDARMNKPTSEGRVFIHKDDKLIKMYAVKCETDFVANSEDFKNISKAVDNGEQVEDVINKLKVSMRENIQPGDSVNVVLENFDSSLKVGTYIHSDGKSGAVVAISNFDPDKAAAVENFAHDACLHMVAFTPAYISSDDVSVSVINEKREIFTAQMANDPKMASKPDNVKEGILNGKIKKALAELCLMDQMFVKDDKHSFKDVMKRECGPDATVAFAKLVTL